jgi:hypothetical protein
MAVRPVALRLVIRRYREKGSSPRRNRMTIKAINVRNQFKGTLPTTPDGVSPSGLLLWVFKRILRGLSLGQIRR